MKAVVLNCTLKPSPQPSNTGALADIGFTIPAQAWTYWHLGPGPGPDHLDDTKGHEWAHSTGRTMAANLVAVARALAESPLPAP